MEKIETNAVPARHERAGHCDPDNELGAGPSGRTGPALFRQRERPLRSGSLRRDRRAAGAIMVGPVALRLHGTEVRRSNGDQEEHQLRPHLRCRGPDESEYLFDKASKSVSAQSGATLVRMRRALLRACGRVQWEMLRPQMRSIFNDLLDNLGLLASPDIVRDAVERYPGLVMGPILGVPFAETRELDRWASTINIWATTRHMRLAWAMSSGPTATWRLTCSRSSPTVEPIPAPTSSVS